MQNNFDYFIEKIPVNIHNHTKSIITTNIAIFVPEKFVTDRKMIVEEYHFVICYTTPPEATIGSTTYQFKKGSLICMAPGDDILVHPFNDSSSVKFVTICVNKEFLEEIYVQSGGKGQLLFHKPDNMYSYQLLAAVEALIYEIINYGETNPLMIESLENRLAIQLLRDSNQKFKIDAVESGGPEDTVQKAIRYIETYYSSNITVKAVSEAIYTSSSYLHKIFLQHVGKTPYQYIMDYRHMKAKSMLETTDISIEEIARQCGFVNSAHFSSTFKQKEGISPLVYRKSLASAEGVSEN